MFLSYQKRKKKERKDKIPNNPRLFLLLSFSERSPGVFGDVCLERKLNACVRERKKRKERTKIALNLTLAFDCIWMHYCFFFHPPVLGHFVQVRPDLVSKGVNHHPVVARTPLGLKKKRTSNSLDIYVVIALYCFEQLNGLWVLKDANTRAFIRRLQLILDFFSFP